MKTIKIISALTLALIIATAGTASSAIPEKPASRDDVAKVVTFFVNVHLTSEIALNGTYLVQLVTDDGRLVAPAQPFVQGITTYTFSAGAATSPWIWRYRVTARLLPVSSSDQSGNAVELFTRPDSKMVIFSAGRSYKFDLSPNLIQKLKPALRNGRE